MAERQKSWYKKWWGVVIVVCIWPIFLLWLVWAKSGKGILLKLAGTVGVVVLWALSLVVLGSVLPSSPSTSPTATQTKTVSTTTKAPATIPKTQPKTTTTEQNTSSTPKTVQPPKPVLTGFGATQDEWNKTHTADPQATANSSYNPGGGTHDCSNFGDRYYGMSGTGNYSMCFPNNQSLATTQAIVMQEFPSDTTILWQGKQTSGEPSECYQMEVHSATLAAALGGSGNAFVELQTLDPHNSSGNIEYNALNVNDALLSAQDNASLSAAPGC